MLVSRTHLSVLLALLLASGLRLFAAEEGAFETKLLQGRVTWQAEALSRLHDVKSVPEAARRNLVLETDQVELYPLIEDVRGRAFRRDERLRGMRVELLVRQHRGSPFIQVIQLFELTDDGKFEVDYWCEICSIAMYELKACDCCQGPIELRKRATEAAAASARP